MGLCRKFTRINDSNGLTALLCHFSVIYGFIPTCKYISSLGGLVVVSAASFSIAAMWLSASAEASSLAAFRAFSDARESTWATTPAITPGIIVYRAGFSSFHPICSKVTAILSAMFLDSRSSQYGMIWKESGANCLSRFCISNVWVSLSPLAASLDSKAMTSSFCDRLIPSSNVSRAKVSDVLQQPLQEQQTLCHIFL